MTTLQTLDDKVKRIVYINNAFHQFFVGDPDKYQIDYSEERDDVLKEAVENDLQELFSAIDAANSDKNLPRRSTIFLILGRIMHCQKMTPALKNKVTVKVLELCQNDEDFFNFIKYYTELRTKCKMPSSVEKLVQKYYIKKSPLELAESVVKFNRLHKWSHKDLIKLSHVKSDTPLKDLVIKYILTRKPIDKASEEEQKILDIIKKSDELKSAKESINAVPIISELKLTIKHVSSHLQNNSEVWLAVLENMSIQEILPYLGKLYEQSMLKANSAISIQIINKLTDVTQVKSDGVHPIDVFSFMKRLEKGGKPMDPKLINYLQKEKKLTEQSLKKVRTRTEAKCPHILNALLKCFDLACNNVLPSNKRYMVTIDVTEKSKNSLCLGNKVLTFLEAAVAYAVILLRVEKDVLLATYKDDKVNLISVEKKISYSDLLEKVKSQTSSYTVPLSSVEWATSEKKHTDVFINFIHNDYLNSVPKNKKSLKFDPIIKYRAKVNLPNAKIITFGLVNKLLPDYQDVPPNVLDILGFDATACKVAESFSRGSFS